MSERIPSISRCLDLIDKYDMLDNIRIHSFKVARVAELLINRLTSEKSGLSPTPSRDTVIAGALLHDIAKTECLDNRCLHAERGYEICCTEGFPEIAEIVREHVILKEFNDTLYKQGIFTAKELVNYADKRVRHDEVVSLADRLDYIVERYGNNDPEREKYIRLNFRQCQKLEVYIFGFLDFSAEQVPRLISQEPFSPA